jgi:predicted HicB family RNase H-like nuclease
MKKNSQIHLWLETELKEKLMKEAEEKRLSLNEFCLQKLRENSQLDRIEGMLEEIVNRG